MKNNREYIKVTINKKGEKQQQDGHPWVYDNEIVDIDGEYENGDIVDVESAEHMFEYTGCDGIMIARGAQGNPWIFKSILECKDYVPTKSERLSMILEHIDNALEYETYEKNAVLKMRKHIAWYLKGIKNSTIIKDRINRMDDINEVKKALIEFLGE